VISGAHAIVYSTNADADRAFFRDVLALPNVDVGGGWLIFGLPPAEVAVHPGDKNTVHELYLMCDDIASLVTALKARGVASDPINDQGWGLLTHITLPGGGKLGIYQPRHARPPAMKGSKGSRGSQGSRGSGGSRGSKGSRGSRGSRGSKGSASTRGSRSTPRRKR
jgi:hypothetical protein